MRRQKKESEKLKISPLILSSYGRKNTIELVGGGKRKERAGERKERLFEDIIAKNFSNLMKNFNLHIQETSQVQVGKTQRDAHQDAL